MTCKGVEWVVGVAGKVVKVMLEETIRSRQCRVVEFPHIISLSDAWATEKGTPSVPIGSGLLI